MVLYGYLLMLIDCKENRTKACKRSVCLCFILRSVIIECEACQTQLVVVADEPAIVPCGPANISDPDQLTFSYFVSEDELLSEGNGFQLINFSIPQPLNDNPLIVNCNSSDIKSCTCINVTCKSCAYHMHE